VPEITLLARDFPEHAYRLIVLKNRMVDLMEPFRKQWLYLPMMKGSYSIKRVLPALVPGISYSDLEIQDGNAAFATVSKKHLPSIFSDTLWRYSPISLCTKAWLWRRTQNKRF